MLLLEANLVLLRPYRAGRRLMDASAKALLHFVAVARDASASSVARASVRRPRLARSSDGGNDAMDNQRTDESDTGRALRYSSTDFPDTSVTRRRPRYELPPHD